MFEYLSALISIGKTAYVEPYEIVALVKDIKSLVSEAKNEESRILEEMRVAILTNCSNIVDAFLAAAEIDVLRAKAKLGIAIDGIIPEVSGTLLMHLCRSLFWLL